MLSNGWGRDVFGDLVRKHRRRLVLSQEDVAGLSGVTVRGLRKIESGQIGAPRPATVRLLADAFGLAGEARDEFFAAAQQPSTVKRVAQAVVPALLPGDVPGFVGRAGALGQLDALLDGPAGPAASVIITAVDGTAGVGKTSLAVHWAHRARDRFPDGQLYINLRGFDPSGKIMTPEEAVNRFLGALAVSPSRMPMDAGAQADLYRTLLADRRMLILLDNARDADQVRPLLPGAPGCLVLVTSRNRLTSLIAAEGARPLPLDLLSFDEARDLLTRRLGEERVAAEPAAVSELISHCSRLPLALAIVAATAATQPEVPLAELVKQLDPHRDSLAPFTTGDSEATDVRAVLSWSYHALTEPAARLFRLLSVHPGPEISTAAAASLASLTIDEIQPLLNQLTADHLIIEQDLGRYVFHDLLRRYATELADQHDAEPVRRAAMRRLVDHYLHSTAAANKQLRKGMNAATALPSPQPGVVIIEIADEPHALSWFDTEFTGLIGVFDCLEMADLDLHVVAFAEALETFLWRRGNWRLLASTQEAAVRSAKHHGDAVVQADAFAGLAAIQTSLGEHAPAIDNFQQAIELYPGQEMDARWGAAHLGLSGALYKTGRVEEARDAINRALAVFRKVGDRNREAAALNDIGFFPDLSGGYEQALANCEQAVAIFAEIGNRTGQAYALHSVAQIQRHLGHENAAAECYERSLKLLREVGNRTAEAMVLSSSGDAYAAAGRSAEAVRRWRKALTIFEDRDHPEGDGVREKLSNVGL